MNELNIGERRKDNQSKRTVFFSTLSQRYYNASANINMLLLADAE